MSAKRFVDTNILIYAHDRSAGQKHEKAKSLVEQLWNERTGVISTQVLQELAVNLRRKAAQPLDATATRAIVADYLTWQVVVNTPESVIDAIDRQERYKISFWDALLIEAAHIAGADILYSEDLSDGQQYGALRVVNPFAETGVRRNA